MPVSLPVSTPESVGVFEAETPPAVVAESAPAHASDADHAGPILIADRGEFIDALRRLRCGHVLVRPRAASDNDRANCVLDSGVVYTAFQPLARYGLIGEYANPEGFATMRYFRLTACGKRFADKALRNWRKRPLIERLAVRFFG